MHPGPPFDVLIIGGGINGAGIARDAAGRGLKVMLVEQDDLAAATSSASSKLIHGGLRYLEQFDFRLVREALAEREVLLSIAPHICRPLTFVLPHEPSLRAAWIIRLGLFMYDHLAARSRLPGSEAIDLASHPAGRPLKGKYKRGFTYADCRVDDSRLVVLNAVDARERGAEIRTRCRFLDARRESGLWRARIHAAGDSPVSIAARVIVNAAGPWVEQVLSAITGQPAPARLRHVQGSHIVVPRLYEGEHAYIVQNSDGRVVFLIPFEGEFTLIGTTEVPLSGPPETVRISLAEADYLCVAASRCLASAVQPSEIVWSYAGVRPLYDDAAADPSSISRDYVLELDTEGGGAPVLSIVGGKITTYRRLAEHALSRVAQFLPGLRPAWTDRAPLPGGDMGDGDFERFLAGFSATRPWLPPPLARRLCRAYGTRAERIVSGAKSLADLGRDLGSGLSEREAEYLVSVEFARTADDILWRRSKLGLRGGAAIQEQAAQWLERNSPSPRSF